MITEVASSGRSRADFQRELLGPFIDRIVRPIYQDPLSDSELGSLSTLNTFDDLQAFAGSLALRAEIGPSSSVLNIRLGEISENEERDLEILRAMCSEEPTHYKELEAILCEGVRSGVVLPLTITSHILGLESSEDFYSKRYVYRSSFDKDSAIDIMRRTEFDKIIGSLTRGPNGFIGADSIDIDVNSPYFFFFKKNDPYLGVMNSQRLRIDEAYKLEDGKVVGLSDEYHISANEKRRAKSHERTSSGCPVRHKFDDSSGQNQEPLVITAKNFLLRTLEQARQLEN